MMLVGAMNHPARKPVDEIGWIADMGLDFIDLTLEPPGAGYWQIDVREIRNALRETGLKVVGHTAYFLPFGHPFEEVRRGAVEALKRSMETFAEVGARWMNVHPDKHAPMHDREYVVRRNLESLSELADHSRHTGVRVMVENIPRDFNSALQLGELLVPLPELGLHLDVGHTELMVNRNTAGEILEAFGHRLRHVHLHDNKGGSGDLHLPLGAGTIDVPSCLRMIRATGYDGTITLEVFTPDREYLRYSAAKLRRLWEEAGM
jgi:sugar phosphate isomerase/epimerase